MSDFPDSEFWDFSLAVYGSGAVAPTCLYLQDRLELDVNLLLFAAWFGASGRGRLDRETCLALTERVDGWHQDVVRHLRQLRVTLRPGYEGAPEALVQSLRRRLQKVEIDAEHIEQLMLSEWAAARPATTDDREKRLADALDNMVEYTLTKGFVGAPERENLTVIQEACGDWLAGQG